MGKLECVNVILTYLTTFIPLLCTLTNAQCCQLSHLKIKDFLLREPLSDASHKKCDNKLSQQNATTNITTKCHNRLLQQIRAK